MPMEVLYLIIRVARLYLTVFSKITARLPHIMHTAVLSIMMAPAQLWLRKYLPAMYLLAILQLIEAVLSIIGGVSS